MARYLTKETSNVHRGIYYLSEYNTIEFEKVRTQVQKFLNASAREEIIFTKGTTEALNLIAQSYGRSQLKSGDQIFITELEHHANIVPWQLLAEEKSLSLKVIPIHDDGSLNLEWFKQNVSPKTKLVSCTMVSNTLGVITDYASVIQIAKSVGAAVVLDAAQAAPHFALDVQALGADFLCFSAHKVFGPNAVGVLWGKQELLEAMPPYQGGGNMIATVSFAKTTWNKLPEKFEAGTPAIAEVLGFGAALQFINEIGIETIEALDRQLCQETLEKLSQVPGFQHYGTHPKRVATFAFNIEGIHPHDLGSVLDKQGVAIRTGHHCTQPLLQRFNTSAVARASFGPYNSSEDIDQLVAALHKARQLFL
jgi:cysteine desulfurase/selenocysteine lyase